MEAICLQEPVRQFPVRKAFQFGGYTATFYNLNLSCGPLRYMDVCIALRGLAEFMVLNGAFSAWSFQIVVRGFPMGAGKIEVSPMGVAEANASAVEIGPLASAFAALQTGVATS